MLTKLRILYAFAANMAERSSDINVHRSLSYIPINLQNLWDNPGAKRIAKRLGRGNASGKGNSCGKGQRGQNSRSGGGVHPRFEGGQTPITRRLPKWGAKPSQEIFKEVNLNQIIDRIIQGRIDSNKTITIKDMRDSGIFRKAIYGVKVLGRGIERLGELKQPLKLEISDASQSVIDAIKSNGGEVICIHRTPLLMREHLFPHKYPLVLRQPIASKKKVNDMKKLQAKGAEVVYTKPKWVIEDEEQEKIKKEMEEHNLQDNISEQQQSEKQVNKKDKKKKKQQQDDSDKQSKVDLSNFSYPAKRDPGIGKDKIRIRKPEIYRKVKIDLE